jgi:hypothetical protein
MMAALIAAVSCAQCLLWCLTLDIGAHHIGKEIAPQQFNYVVVVFADTVIGVLERRAAEECRSVTNYLEKPDRPKRREEATEEAASCEICILLPPELP